ncbi:hypothetical protein Pan54_41810 [Rubinisphaera italica]|uniref:Uncharacterized protein n=1 Tax=Rubinisphaera italica TaxID=2527969 RepID=A0A5C5XL45_9PLAN|nr:hypothetical protein Pan54_41810 [Rubinisphaera italica]
MVPEFGWSDRIDCADYLDGGSGCYRAVSYRERIFPIITGWA